MANIQKGDSLASDSVTECYVGTVTHFRNESQKRDSSNVNAGDKQRAEQVQTGSNQNGSVVTTTTAIAKDNTEKKEEVVVTVPTPAPVTNHAKKGSNKKRRKRKLGTGTGPDPQGLESSSKASSVCGGRASKTGSKVLNDFSNFQLFYIRICSLLLNALLYSI